MTIMSSELLSRQETQRQPYPTAFKLFHGGCKEAEVKGHQDSRFSIPLFPSPVELRLFP